MAAAGHTHLGVVLALWERGELQFHVLHGPAPRRGSSCRLDPRRRKEGGPAERRAEGPQLTPAGQAVPATPVAAAAATGTRRAVRLLPGRHAAASLPPPRVSAPLRQPWIRHRHQPHNRLPAFLPTHPRRPSQSQPTLVWGPPPAAARCQRAAAPPLRESAGSGGRGLGRRAPAARRRGRGGKAGSILEGPGKGCVIAQTRLQRESKQADILPTRSCAQTENQFLLSEFCPTCSEFVTKSVINEVSILATEEMKAPSPLNR